MNEHNMVENNPPASSSEHTWMIAAHLSAIVAMLISAGWLSFIGPLVVWLIKKEENPRIRIAGAQSFNFNLSMWLANVAAWIGFFTIILIPVSIIVWIAVFILTLYHHIRASIAASNNQPYHYPWQIKVLN